MEGQDSVEMEMDVSMEGVSGLDLGESSIVQDPSLVSLGNQEGSFVGDDESVGNGEEEEGNEGEGFEEIAIGCNFKFLVEKVIGADLRTAAWCPTMDLLALATIGASGTKKLGAGGLEDIELQSSLGSSVWIQRAGSANTWQRLETIPAADNVGGSLLTNLVWRPDGKALATGHVDGSLAIYSIENGELLAHHQPIRNTNDGKRAITSLCWSVETKPKEQNEKKGFDDKILLPLRSEDIESLISQPLTILITSDTSLRIDLRAFGMFSIGTFDLASALKLNLSSPPSHKIETINLSANFSRLSLILSSPSPPSPFSSKKKRKVEVVILDTSLLFQFREELRALAIHIELINALIDRLASTLDTMRDKWKETRGLLWSKFLPLVQLLKVEGKTPESMKGFAGSTTLLDTQHSVSLPHQSQHQQQQQQQQESQYSASDDSIMRDDGDSQSQSLLSDSLVSEEHLGGNSFLNPSSSTTVLPPNSVSSPASSSPATDGPTDLEGKLIAREFLKLLATGLASHALRVFLANNLNPQALARLAKSIDSACYSIQQQILAGLQPALDQLLARLSSLRGLALWKERFEPIGLEDAYVSDILCKASVWKLQLETFLVSIEKVRSDYRYFFDWLAKAQFKLDEDTAPPLKKQVSIDEIKVSEFLLRFEVDSIAVYLSLLQTSELTPTSSCQPATSNDTANLSSSKSTHHLTPTSIAPLSVADLRQLVLGSRNSSRSGSLLSRMKRKKNDSTQSQSPGEDGTGVLAPASLHSISVEIRELANSSFNRPSETVGSTFKVCCRQPLFEHEEGMIDSVKQEELEGDRKGKGALTLNQSRLNQLISFLSTPTAQYLAFRATVPKELDMDDMGMPIQREPDDPYAPCQGCIIILKTSQKSEGKGKKDVFELSLIRLPSLVTDVTQLAFFGRGELAVLMSQKGSKAKPPPPTSKSSSSAQQPNINSQNSVLALIPCRAPSDEIDEPEQEEEEEEAETEQEEEEEEEEPSLLFMEFDPNQTRQQMLVEMAFGVFMDDPPEALPEGSRSRVQYNNRATGMAVSGTRKVGFVLGNTRKVIVYDLADEEDEEEVEEEGVDNIEMEP